MPFIGRSDAKDPGTQQDQWERVARRRERLYAEDEQFRVTKPDDQIAAATRERGKRIAEVMATVLQGYADRPALVIRLAITGRLKPLHYISTMGISAVAHQLVDEDTDIRRAVPACTVNDSYANGYGISKWAGEVLMREAHDLCGLPVAVFRPGMILADSRYAGQLNVPDIFTRLLFSLVATGVAPRSFYRGDESAGKQAKRPHYEGLPVDFLADAIAAIGPQHGSSFDTYNTTNPHDDGISLDTFVDWIIAAGYPIEKIDDYPSWLTRFETAMRALPERQRAQSVLTVLDVYREPMIAVAGSPVPGARFQAAVQGSGREIPHLSKELIEKYLVDLERLGVLSK
jgi:fatty acid CoA ligase FadD9